MLASHVRDYVIIPTLKFIGKQYFSDSAVNLLLGTCAQETHMGEYLYQINGSAAGIYQIEEATHNDLYENYLQFNNSILEKIIKLLINFIEPNFGMAPQFCNENLIGNLYYSTAIARLLYYRHSEPLPNANDIEGLAKYWKKYYNTDLGNGTVEQFVDNYHRFIGKK